MEVVMRNVKEIHRYSNNPRKNDRAVEKVRASIRQYGIRQPIVLDADDVIVVGDTRYLAAIAEGHTEVPCHPATDLTPQQIQEYRLVDNKVAEYAKWDKDRLRKELADLEEQGANLDLFDFDLSADDVAVIVPEVEFTPELREEHNYIVLRFENEVDWLQALTLLDIVTKQALPGRVDGTVNPNMKRRGVGRVLDGPTAIEQIRGSI